MIITILVTFSLALEPAMRMGPFDLNLLTTGSHERNYYMYVKKDSL